MTQISTFLKNLIFQQDKKHLGALNMVIHMYIYDAWMLRDMGFYSTAECLIAN